MPDRPNPIPTDCDICGEPGVKRGTRGVLCDKHDTRLGSLRRTSSGSDPKIYPVGGSETVQAPIMRGVHPTQRLMNTTPDGYISWHAYCKKNDKCDDHGAYRKLRELGLSCLFMGTRIVRADALWPTRANYPAKEAV